MPEYALRGITVQFPHEAYECQLVRQQAAADQSY